MATALQEASQRLEDLDPQVRTEVIPGVLLRKKENGIPVLTIHYSADPDRNPNTEKGAEWIAHAKSDYSSDSAWQREQEIDALAGGGERVFAKALKTFAHKTIISDPNWVPDPRWDVVMGFDHGGTNATALVKGYVDFQGNIYMAGEYYSFKRPDWDNEVWQNAPEMLKMPDLARARWCMADPSIFFETQVQADGRKAAIVASYKQNGVRFLNEYTGERSDITFVERLLSNHWKDLAHREPNLFIVCRNPSDRLQPGLHPYDCPNLLWELLRTRRAQLSATQMTSKNPTEKIVDKQNHARDAFKYLYFSVRRAAEVPLGERLQKVVEGLNPTSAQMAAQRFWAENLRKKAKTVSMRTKGKMR
jgi:hypothetical protein